MIRRGLVLVTLCLAAGSAFAQDAKFDLAKKPTFRPGDTVKLTSTKNMLNQTTEGNQVTETGKEIQRESSVEEVLAVDDAGMPTAIRVTIETAEIEETAAVGPGVKETQKTSLRNICFTRKREGIRYAWDTTSVIAQDPNALTSPQIGLLKRIEQTPSQWAPYPQNDVLLMPKAPVSLAQAWEPSAAELKKWVEGDPTLSKAGAKFRSAQFKLASAEGKVAAIEGNLAATLTMRGTDLDLATLLRAKIDTQSGRWVETSDAGSMSLKTASAAVKIGGDDKEKLVFTAGSGKASAAPAWTNKIGWAKPPADTNGFKDKDHGVSLDVPKDFKPVPDQVAAPVIAFFKSEETGAVITMTALQTPYMVDLVQVVPAATASMKKGIADYQVVKQSPLTLPGNVPAILVVATAQGGKLNVITLIVQDGKKSVSTTLVSTAESKVSADDLVKIAQTLRTFDEDE